MKWGKASVVQAKDLRYKFEKAWLRGGRSHRGGEEADQECDVMIARLGLRLQLHGPLGELAPLIRRYVVECQLNIGWYQGALLKELWWRRWFFLISLLMLIGVPVFVLKLPSIANQALAMLPQDGAPPDLSKPQHITAQITAVLTGLLAFQRAISAWLDKRKVAGGYAQAMAKLKELLWALHLKWDGREMTPAIKNELTNDLRKGIKEARRIVSEEQTAYFQNLSYPTIDVGALLKSSGADAAAIVGAHKAPQLKAMEKRHEHQSAIATASALMAEYRDLIGRKQKEHRDLVAAGDAAQAERVSKEIAELYRKLNAAELDHAVATAGLAALATT